MAAKASHRVSLPQCGLKNEGVKAQGNFKGIGTNFNETVENTQVDSSELFVFEGQEILNVKNPTVCICNKGVKNTPVKTVSFTKQDGHIWWGPTDLEISFPAITAYYDTKWLQLTPIALPFYMKLISGQV